MPSKLVTDRQKSATLVAAAGEAHAAQVADKLATLLTPYLQKGEKLPDIALLCRLVARGIAASAEAMAAADEAHALELLDDEAPRTRRDGGTTTLYATLVDLREIGTGLLGGAAMKALGLDGSTPQDPVVLLRFSSAVVTALSTQKIPPSRVPGATFQADEWVKRIEKEQAPLELALKDVAREAREAEATLGKKNKSIADYGEWFTRGASFLSGVFRLGGETDLADRVKPSTRRPGQVAQGDTTSDPTADPTASTSGGTTDPKAGHAAGLKATAAADVKTPDVKAEAKPAPSKPTTA